MSRLGTGTAIIQELRPRGIGELMDRSVELWRQHLWVLFKHVLPAQLLLFIVSKIYVTYFMGPLQPTKGAPDPAAVVFFMLGSVAFMAVVILCLLFFAFQWAVAAHYLGHLLIGERKSMRDGYRALAGKLGPFLVSLLHLGLVAVAVSIVSGVLGGILGLTTSTSG